MEGIYLQKEIINVFKEYTRDLIFKKALFIVFFVTCILLWVFSPIRRYIFDIYTFDISVLTSINSIFELQRIIPFLILLILFSILVCSIIVVRYDDYSGIKQKVEEKQKEIEQLLDEITKAEEEILDIRKDKNELVEKIQIMKSKLLLSDEESLEIKNSEAPFSELESRISKLEKSNRTNKKNLQNQYKEINLLSKRLDLINNMLGISLDKIFNYFVFIIIIHVLIITVFSDPKTIFNFDNLFASTNFLLPLLFFQLVILLLFIHTLQQTLKGNTFCILKFGRTIKEKFWHTKQK